MAVKWKWERVKIDVRRWFQTQINPQLPASHGDVAACSYDDDDTRLRFRQSCLRDLGVEPATFWLMFAAPAWTSLSGYHCQRTFGAAALEDTEMRVEMVIKNVWPHLFSVRWSEMFNKISQNTLFAYLTMWHQEVLKTRRLVRAENEDAWCF